MAAGLAALFVLVTGAAWWWRSDLAQALLDPGVPYPLYQPPPAPDYAKPSAWVLLPADAGRDASTAPGADVFFVHPTTYDRGRQWNGPIDDPRGVERLARVMLPNYAGPFQQVGRVFAPRYRQAGLYSFSTLRDDAREARRFAYGDVRTAFDVWRARFDRGRPLVIAGVEQGADLAARLGVEVAADPALRSRLVAVYLQGTVVPAAEHGPDTPLPACRSRQQARCVIGWAEAPQTGEADARTLLDRALLWNPRSELENLDRRPALCVNPVTGTEHGAAGAREARGAADATGMEWGARPAFLPREVATACRGGLLRVGRPQSPGLRAPPSLLNPLKAAPFNLFYADLEADAKSRLSALTGGRPSATPAPPIRTSVVVRAAPVHRIDGGH